MYYLAMNLSPSPTIQVESVSGAVRVSVSRRLSIGTVLNVALLLVFGSFLVRGWSQFKLLDKFLLSLCVASGVLNAARQFLSQEVH